MHFLKSLGAGLRNRHQRTLEVAGDCLNFGKRQLGSLSNLLKHLSDRRCWILRLLLLWVDCYCIFLLSVFCFLFSELNAFSVGFPKGWLAQSGFLKALNLRKYRVRQTEWKLRAPWK